MQNQFEKDKKNLLARIESEHRVIQQRIRKLKNDNLSESDVKNKLTILEKYSYTLTNFVNDIKNFHSEQPFCVLLTEFCVLLRQNLEALDVSFNTCNTNSNAPFFKQPHQSSLSHYINILISKFLTLCGLDQYAIELYKIRSGSVRDLETTYNNIEETSYQLLNKYSPTSS